ncbi:MAG TPA: ACP phosphodiesterase [Geobacteraceae bacterium]|nr:ACP phosphodiesterase [Geobacteraceae bacterium]
MNFLFHLYLSGDDAEILVGNLMGDFVKGKLAGRFPAGIEEGIMFHRRIDSFAGMNRHFLGSKRRLDVRFGHFRGVLVDLYYDHFLAVHWDDYAAVPFMQFLADTRLTVKRYGNVLPDRLRAVEPYIFGELLPSYLEVAGIERALTRMSGRIERRNPLAEGGEELRRHYGEICEDFRGFIAEAREFAREERKITV